MEKRSGEKEKDNIGARKVGNFLAIRVVWK
jgi:hypothetical protein